MYIDTINLSDIPFCCSKELWRDELQKSICEKANSILLELNERDDSFVELRATPAGTAEFLVLMELFWNVFSIKLSPITNTKHAPVGFTAVRGCEKPNDLEGYYKFLKSPPPPVKIEHPKPRPKPKKVPLMDEVSRKEINLGLTKQILGAERLPDNSKKFSIKDEDFSAKIESVLKERKLSDAELRKRFLEITVKRSFSERRAGFGNVCYAQDGDDDCSKTMWVGSLFYAIQENDYAAAKCQLKRGANANARDLDGKTPLFHVMHDPKMIRLLIEYGADPNALDNKGFTPMIVARAYQLVSGNSSFVNALKDCGAN